MLPWKQPENFAARIFDSSSQSRHDEDAHVETYEESHLHGIGKDDSIALDSPLEDPMNTMSDYMCADHDWPYYISMCGGDATADDELSLNFLESIMEPEGQCETLSSPCRSIFPVHLSGETSGSATYQQKIDAPFDNRLNGYHNMIPNTHSNSLTSFLPSFVTGESSEVCLADTETSSIHPSPVYSDASTSFAVASQYDSFYMGNRGSEHLSTHVGTYDSENSLHTLISPRLSYGNVRMAYSGLSTSSSKATSDGDFFDSEASSLLTFACASPHDVKSAAAEALNQAMMVNWPQRTRSGPTHKESSQCMDTARNPTDSEAQIEVPVTFLVESDTITIEDGYTWRKYGQKIIKDRKHPRSYFKCAQLDCPIKKQTEFSSEEQGFVLITYNGKHNH